MNDAHATAQHGGVRTIVLLVVTILIGLLLGPVQLIYCLFLSGAIVSEHPCIPGQPVTVALSPKQNPIRFLARVEYIDPGRVQRTRHSPGPAERTASFDGQLRFDGRLLWSERFEASGGSTNQGSGVLSTDQHTGATSSLKAFSIEEPGDYEFVVRAGPSQLRVESITLKVREHVTELHLPTTVGGSLVMLFGIGVAVFVMIRASKRRRVADDRTPA